MQNTEVRSQKPEGKASLSSSGFWLLASVFCSLSFLSCFRLYHADLRGRRQVGCDRVAQTIDARADGAQFRLDLFVAAINMIDALDERLAFGDKTGQHERRGGAQIRRLHARARQGRRAGDDGRVAFDAYARAHALQLADVRKTVLED